jgi:hypothetical protein
MQLSIFEKIVLWICKPNRNLKAYTMNCNIIAETHNPAKVWVAYTEYTLSQKIIAGEISTICDFRYVSSIPRKRKVFGFG